MTDKRSSENYDEINIAFINFYLYKSEALQINTIVNLFT